MKILPSQPHYAGGTVRPGHSLGELEGAEGAAADHPLCGGHQGLRPSHSCHEDALHAVTGVARRRS